MEGEESEGHACRDRGEFGELRDVEGMRGGLCVSHFDRDFVIRKLLNKRRENNPLTHSNLNKLPSSLHLRSHFSRCKIAMSPQNLFLSAVRRTLSCHFCKAHR